MIDLHTHSTASDGTLAPAALPGRAAEIGLSAVALTDHDTVSGLTEFMDAGERLDVMTVPGVEIACQYQRTPLHFLGLFVAPENTPLQILLEQIRADRDLRNTRILEKLNNAGARLTRAQVEACRQGHVTGRPHFAQALVKQGCCRTVKAAFKRYLSRGCPCYVPRRLPAPERVLTAIHDAGGVAIWAHPATSMKLTGAKLRRTCRALVDLGLDGLEVFYPEYSAREQRLLRQAADELNLLQSGGTDFHGDYVPHIRLGVGTGDLVVPDSLLKPLRARALSKDTDCACPSSP